MDANTLSVFAFSLRVRLSSCFDSVPNFRFGFRYFWFCFCLGFGISICSLLVCVSWSAGLLQLRLVLQREFYTSVGALSVDQAQTAVQTPPAPRHISGGYHPWSHKRGGVSIVKMQIMRR